MFTASNIKRYCLGTILIIVCCLLPTYSYSAEPNTISNQARVLFLELSKQLNSKIANETGENTALRKSVMQEIYSGIFWRFYASQAFNNIESNAQLSDLNRKKSKVLRHLDILDLALCYAEGKQSYEKFFSKVKTLAHKRNLAFDWQQSYLKKALEDTYNNLREADKNGFVCSTRGYYNTRDWGGELRFSWYPTEGQINIYSIITFTNNPSIRTAIVNCSAKVYFSNNKPYLQTVNTKKYSLNVGTRSYEAAGRWSSPNVKNFSSDNSALFVDNSCRLKIKGNDISGRVLESIMSTKHSGAPWEIEYKLTGKISENGTISGSCKITAEDEVLKARLGKADKINSAHWKASLDGDFIKGTIYIDGAPEITWQAKIAEK